MSKPRDSQRSKLYAAEREAFPEMDTTPEYTTNDECKAYVDKVLGRAVVKRHYPRLVERGVEVRRPNMGQRRALAHAGLSWDGQYVISLPRWARSRTVILHELAHQATRFQGAAHGWQFAAAYLKLVRTMLGVEAEAKLKAAFRKHRVRWTQPKRRQLTVEQREAMRVRMAELRARKAELAAATQQQ